MNVLGVETSCDETSVAVVRDGRVILANVISSQIELHRPYGGVVPELASRHHLELLRPVVDQALATAGVRWDEIDAVGATAGPGLASSLLIGLNAAKGLAVALGKPFVPINHLEAHLYAPLLQARCHSELVEESRSLPPAPDIRLRSLDKLGKTTTEGMFAERPTGVGFGEFFPLLSLIVSGGHTLLVLASGVGCHCVLGQTRDDAAGEAFDKVAKLLGLGYPGGPEIDRRARAGNPAAIAFPRGMLDEPGYDFSFSGLKTAVMYHLRRHGAPVTAQHLADLCASFQEAVVDVLVAKTMRAAADGGARAVSASGGVSANSGLRQRLGEACASRGLPLLLADAKLCTDNAAMVAALAWHKLQAGAATDWAVDVEPSAGLPDQDHASETDCRR